MNPATPTDRARPDGVSVVVPTCRRPDLLRRALEGLAGQIGGVAFEVIVADNAPTPSAPRDVDRPWPFPLRYVAAGDIRGPSYPRNRGARLARYRYLAFLDDDAVPEPDWVHVIRDFFRAHPEVGVLAGRMEAYRLEHPLEHSRQCFYDRREARYLSPAMTDALAGRYGLARPADYFLADFFTAANTACRAAVFDALDGFDNEIVHGQDHDLAVRALQHGHAVAYVPAMRVRHEHGRSYRTFITKSYHHGTTTVDRIVFLEKRRTYPRECRVRLAECAAAIGECGAALLGDAEPGRRRDLALLAAGRALHLAGTLAWGPQRLFGRRPSGGTS